MLQQKLVSARPAAWGTRHIMSLLSSKYLPSTRWEPGAESISCCDVSRQGWASLSAGSGLPLTVAEGCLQQRIADRNAQARA